MNPTRGRAGRRGLLATATAVLGSTLLLSAYGGAATAAASPPDRAAPASAGRSSSPSGTLGWFFWVGSPAETKVWQHNAALVTQKYPNLHVNLTTTSWTDFWTKLPLEASTKSVPCIIGLQYGYVGSVGNLYVPLNSLVKRYGLNLSQYSSTMLKELSVNGKLLALPYDYGPVVIAYDPALFKAKGVPLPKAGWTWSQFVSDAKKLTGGGDYGYLPGLSLELDYDLTGVPDAYVQHGKFNLTNAAFEKGIQEQAALSYQDHVAPTYSEAPNWSTAEFDSGKVAMEVAGPWDLVDIKGQAPFDVQWVEFPSGPDGMHTYNEGSGFGISKDCPDPQAAFQALEVLTGAPALSYAGETGRALPARPADDGTWNKFAGGNAGAVMAQALQPAVPQEVTTNWTAFQTAISKYEPLVLSGSMSAAKFAQEVQAAAGSGTGVAPGNLSSLLGSSS